MNDIVERLRKQSRRVAELYGDDEPPDQDMKPADQLWFTCQAACDEIERLRAGLARADALIAWIDGACTDQKPHAEIEAAITRYYQERKK